MTSDPVGIAYLDGPRLRRSLLAAADWVDAAREELNRINVFPVPDGDTGTNFAATMRAVAEGVRPLEGAHLPTVTKAMAQACVFNARGNSGMLLSHFLIGFKETVGADDEIDIKGVARGFRGGSEHVINGLDEPVEGTILTVCRDAADAAEEAAAGTSDLGEFMQTILERARDSLARTPQLLAVLREAGVVDAGAKAFVRVLEGVVRLIQGDPIVAAEVSPDLDTPDAAAMVEVAHERDFRYCTEVLVRCNPVPSSTAVRSQLRPLGGSIVVLANDDLLKVHVHTDTPENVFALADEWGAIEKTKADDMREQHRELLAARRRIGFVVDSSCDLPDELIDRHGLVIVPVQVISGDHVWLDRVEIGKDEVYQRMVAKNEIFTTSQPTPGALMQAFEDAATNADEVIGLFLGGNLSGTIKSAHAAVQARRMDNVSILDSRTISWGLGLLALKAAELAEQGWERAAILKELDRIRDQSGAIITVDTFDNLVRSGRVGRGRAFLGGLFDIKPILEVIQDGSLVPLDRVRGRDNLMPRVFEHLDRRLTPRPTMLRMAIVHAGIPEIAHQLCGEITARYAPAECHVGTVTAAIGVHTGPGAWGIFYQIEDPATP